MYRWQRLRCERVFRDLQIKRSQQGDTVALALSGAATVRHVNKAISYFREALPACKSALSLDLSNVRTIDARFLGLLLMLRKQLRRQGAKLKITGASSSITKLFRLNGAQFLLNS